MKSPIILLLLLSNLMGPLSSPSVKREIKTSIDSLCNQDIYYNKEIQKVLLCPSDYAYIAVINDQHCIYCVRNLLKEILTKYEVKYDEILIVYFSSGEYFSPIVIREYLYGLNAEFKDQNLYFAKYNSGFLNDTLRSIEKFYSMKTPVVYIREKDEYALDSSFLELK